MNIQALNELRNDLMAKMPELYQKMLEDPENHIVQKELNAWLGRVPFAWDYEQFTQFCIKESSAQQD